MAEFLPVEPLQWLIPLAAILLLLTIWLIYRRRTSAARRLKRVFAEIGYDRIDNLIVPYGDEGEIQIDHLFLTSQGLLIVDIKDVVGTVFGSDKMQDWAVISEDRRYTFSNPQPSLYDRIAAVSDIVRQVPVAGRILFLDGAEFTKGVPGLVSSLDELASEFGEDDKKAAKVRIEAFKPHWELIQKAARGAPS